MSAIAILQQPSFQDAANSPAFIDLPASRNISRHLSFSDLSKESEKETQHEM
jgi:hypothetical protein